MFDISDEVWFDVGGAGRFPVPEQGDSPMSTCTTCGKDFTGGFVKHAIKDHPRKVKTTQAPTPTGVTGGDLEITWGAAGTAEQDLAQARESRSPVRTAAKVQVTKGPRTPAPSARSARTDARNAIPARERALKAQLREARRAMRRIEAQLVDVRA